MQNRVTLSQLYSYYEKTSLDLVLRADGNATAICRNLKLYRHVGKMQGSIQDSGRVAMQQKCRNSLHKKCWKKLANCLQSATASL